MKHYHLNEISTPYLTFPILENIPWITHGFSTRLGGVSSGIHSTMNLGFLNGDIPENVVENYQRICSAIGVNPQSVVHAKQTHKDQYRVVTTKDCGKGYCFERDYDDIDALITNQAGITLTILTADCVPVYLVDPVQKAIGLVHSGWRGTVQRIAAKTVEGMRKNFGTKPEDVLAVTGPCICKSCFEVGDEVADAFLQEFGSEKYMLISEIKNGKAHIDLPRAIAESLVKIGLKPDNIQMSGLCTACKPELLFSHRITKGKRGTLAAMLAMRDNMV